VQNCVKSSDKRIKWLFFYHLLKEMRLNLTKTNTYGERGDYSLNEL
jgi:hypothetical protein